MIKSPETTKRTKKLKKEIRGLSLSNTGGAGMTMEMGIFCTMSGSPIESSNLDDFSDNDDTDLVDFIPWRDITEFPEEGTFDFYVYNNNGLSGNLIVEIKPYGVSNAWSGSVNGVALVSEEERSEKELNFLKEKTGSAVKIDNNHEKNNLGL